MFAKGFRIVDKKRFEIYIENVELEKNEAIVKIDTAAICKADLRYYLGLRDKRVLGMKYPISLLHEAIGTVIKDPTGRFEPGDKVTLCPNVVDEEERSNFKNLCNLYELGENYCPKAKFASSSIDGFSRDIISFPVRNLIKLPNNVSKSIAVFSELISIAESAIRRVEVNNNYNIAIWGDGLLGYILYCVLIENGIKNIVIVGHNESKLNQFKEAECFTTDEFDKHEFNIDIAFECVGGKGAESAINQIIDKVKPGTRIVLTGVSENNVAINTRKILEKGLALYGVTRSNIEDFRKSVELFNSDKFKEKMGILVLSEMEINNINDYYDAFELEANNKKLGKNIMHFNF